MYFKWLITNCTISPQLVWWLHGGTGCSEKKAVSSPAVGRKPLTLRWLSTIVGPQLVSTSLSKEDFLFSLQCLLDWALASILPGAMRWLIVTTFIVSLSWLVSCEKDQVSKIIVFLYLLSTAGQRRSSENKAWEAEGNRREDNWWNQLCPLQ